MTEPVERNALEAAQAEVDTELESDDGSVLVPLRTKVGDAEIRVPAVSDWDAEAIEFLEGRKFMSWARAVLSDADWRLWSDLRPTLGEADKFFGEWGELSGQESGKSRPSRRALRRMARR